MRLSRERKALVSLLGLGMMALAVDRLVLGTGDTLASENRPAVMAGAKDRVPQADSAAARPSAKVESRQGTISVAQRLQGYSQSGGQDIGHIQDAFQPSAAWVPATRTESASVVAAPSAGDGFRQAHRLTGVLVSGRLSHAMVDGKMLAVGQSIDGFRLASVTQQAALFKRGKDQVVLRLQEPGDALAGSRP